MKMPVFRRFLSLFPAWAGVIPMQMPGRAWALSFPRMGGGDPGYYDKRLWTKNFSPQAQGYSNQKIILPTLCPQNSPTPRKQVQHAQLTPSFHNPNSRPHILHPPTALPNNLPIRLHHLKRFQTRLERRRYTGADRRVHLSDTGNPTRYPARNHAFRIHR